MGGSLAREKDLGGDGVRTMREGSYIGRPGGQRLQYDVSGGYTRETVKLAGSGNS